PLRLFTKRVTEGRTPDQIDALDASDFDEAAWPGYQPAALTPAGWTIEVGSPTAAVHAPRTFARLTSGDPETVWGYYVTRSDGRLLRSEEHTSELQSRENLVCRLMLEKKNISAIA